MRFGASPGTFADSRPPAGGSGSHLARFLRREEGATTVEFALISVPFLALIFSIFQVSLVFLMQQGLRVAVDNAARQVLLGKAQTNSAVTSWQTFRDTLVCPASGSLLPSFITCSKVLVDVRKYTSFSNLSTGQSFITDGSGPTYNPGTACDIVVVRAAYPMPVYLPFLMDASLGSSVSAGTAGLTSYGGSLVQMLTAASVFRNEPYTSGPNVTTAGGCA
ncbi:MAG: pilus assembly protein [Actinomycetospora chiangmaiensis]|nr:pilus assembly protein [Actinomycetospora chiangmaiensis]